MSHPEASHHAVNVAGHARRRDESVESQAPPSEAAAMSKINEAHEGATAAVRDGWVSGGSFLSSILAGLAIGWGLDAWLGTDPWFVVAGVVAGSVSGFYGMKDQVTAVQGKRDIFDG